MSLIIVLNGGIVSCVVTHDADLIGQGYDVVDYDVEGIDDADITMIKQGYSHAPQETEDAYVYGGNVTKARITVR